MPEKEIDKAPLATEQLYRHFDPVQFGFSTTEELDDIKEPLGQERALSAVAFGSEIKRHGYNLFVLGPPGSGKHDAIMSFLEEKANQEQTPPDWIYVNNFETPHKPIALALPAGQASRVRQGMNRLIDDLRTVIPAIFESDEYRSRRRAILDAFSQAQESAFSELRDHAEKKGVALMRTPMGFAMAPMENGKVIEPEAFNRLTEDTRNKVEKDIEELQKELEGILENIPVWDKERREKIRTLNQELAEVAVSHNLREIEQDFAHLSVIAQYLSDVRRNLIERVDLFLSPTHNDGENETTAFGEDEIDLGRQRFDRYRVNVIVDNRPLDRSGSGAPVIEEDHPVMGNLVGRVEHMSRFGTLTTGFNLIKPGVLHRANGGYLLIDARKVLSEPFAWESLKRALKSEQIKIESPGEFMSLVSTITLEPDPIPLNVKVLLFGDRYLYYLLCSLDPEFSDLFKVAADFDETIDRSEASAMSFARLLATLCRKEELLHLTADGVARVLEHAARLAEDSEKLSLHIGHLSDILREADFWARSNANTKITAKEIQKAIDEQIYRSDRMREISHEAISRNVVFIDTEGETTGQINALSVLSLGNFSFGKPTRITANVRMGSGQLIDIEREVELGGALHSKGVLILSSFLAERYALEVPLSLRASLVFEQSYGGVDGDSASCAELFALLSAISGVPIKQSFAVTGSVNQKGQVQPIGGVNEKIEGFYDICNERSLTGNQGVLIPRANVKHLMLRKDVVDACATGKFRVFAIETVDSGIEILTGFPAGARGGDGFFPKDSFNRRVEEQLVAYAESRRRFGTKVTEGEL